MSNLNQVQIIGRLGQDPEIKYMPNGKAVANISIATSEKWKDQSGAQQEKTEWHRVTMYDRLAEIVGEYVSKGSLIFIQGKLQTRKWVKDGVDMYTTEIIAQQMQMLDSKQQGTQHQGGQQPRQQQQSQQAQQNNQQGQSRQPQQQSYQQQGSNQQQQYNQAPNADYDSEPPF